MVTVETAPTDALAPADMSAIRRLLDRAFAGTFGDDDWDHALGGEHVLVRDGGVLVAHASVVARRMWIADDEVRVGYVEAVATAPERQGEELGSAAMRKINELLHLNDLVGVLSTGAWHFYERLGWERWLGTTHVRQPDGTTTPTPGEDDGIMILCADHRHLIDRSSPLTCEARPGDDW